MPVKLRPSDTIFSKVVREANNWTCEICGKVSDSSGVNGQMQCSHDNGRTSRLTRWHPDNVICSCAACHWETTKKPRLHVEVFDRIKTTEVTRLMRELAQSVTTKVTKRDEADITLHYRAELKRIEQLRADGHQGKIEINIPEQLL